MAAKTDFDRHFPAFSSICGKTGAQSSLSKLPAPIKPILVTITRGFVNDEPLVVYLNGPSTSRCSYPSSVTIPAGEASVTFELGAASNEKAEIGASFTLRASAAGYNSITQTFDVEDDDVPAVTLEIYPEEISEGAGATAAYAILSRVDQKNIAEAITVNLSADMAKQLILPSSMTIPAYTMAVRFAIGTVDNSEDEGDREVTITGSIYIPSCGCSGQPSTGDMIEATVYIIDNDVPALKLTASPSTMKEGLDHAGDLILSHNSALAEDLVVTLSYDTPGEIDIPQYAVIPAGETSVRVPVRTLDDGIMDGGKLVSVYADDETLVFSSASTWIQVSDQNLPDYKVTDIAHPGTVFAGGKFTFEFETANTGFIDGTDDIEYEVYLIGGRRGNATAPSNKVGHGKIRGGVPMGESIATPFSMTAPDVVADYRIVVVLDPSGKAGELDGANNTLTSSALSVTSAYQPTANVAEKTMFMQGEAVPIVGVALLPDGTTPASGVAVDVYVISGNFRRTFSATTDAEGRFSAVYTPSQGEAGHYKVGACYPGVGSSVVHDEFDILGMRRTPTANIIWDIGQGESGERYVYIENRSAVPITGLSATFENVPEECDFTYTLPDNIPGQGSVLLTMSATATGVTEQTDYKTITARLECDEGLELSFPLYFHSKAQKAYLRSNPKSISTTMAIGGVRCIDITVANDGKGDSGLITAALPDVPWLKFVTYDTIENLKYGQSATLTLAVAPTYDDGLVLNNPRKGGSLVISCENGTGCVIPLSFTPVSDGTGSVKVDALDNNSYVLESSPHLAGASVVLSNPYTGEVVARGTTGSSGTWAGKSIPEGTYKATVSADNHDSWTGMVTVEPGMQATIMPFLQCKIVTVTWNVEKTEIEDSYEITLLLDYETRVPAPVVKTHVPSELPELDEGDSYAFPITLENTGVITAEKVTLAMPEIPGYTITLSDNNVSVPAKSSVTISAVLSRPARSRKASMLKAGETVVTVTKTVCYYPMRTHVAYLCGKEYPEYSYDTLIGIGVCTTETIKYVITDPPPKPADPDPPKPIRPDPQPPSPPVEPKEPEPSPDVVWPKTGCDPCIDALRDAMQHAIEAGNWDLYKLLRDELYSQIPFSTCIDLGVNSLMTFVPSANEAIKEASDLPVLHELIGDHFESYKERRTGLHGVISATLDAVGCAADGLAAAATAASDGTLAVPSWVTAQGIRNFAHKVKVVQETVINPLSDLWTRYQQAEDAFYDVVLDSLGPDSDIGRRINLYCQTGHDDRLRDDIIDWTVVDVWFISTTGMVSSVGGNLWEDDFRLDQVVDVVTNAFELARESDDGKINAEDVLDKVSDDLPEDDVAKWVDDWNDAVDRWMSGTYKKDAPIDIFMLIYYAVRNRGTQQYMKEHGYSDVVDMMDHVLVDLRDILDSNSDSVCASVKLKLSQTLTMTREAFDGTLTLYNGNDSVAITDIALDVSILDEEGNECKDLFEYFANGVTGAMSEGSVLEGGLSVSPGGTGSALVRFIPERGAAPTEDKLYRFGGTVTYVDPFSGERATVTLTPVSLTVSPSPYLHLDYFVQRDVYADDPFTEDIVEASMPAELAVLVRNVGGANANNVTIASAQPEVVQNEKGLAVEFDLRDYTLDGSAVDGEEAHLGLRNVSLGTIAPDEAKVAQWWLTSSIQGHFAGMSATVTPVNSWNTPDTMLVDPEIGVHKLIRSVVADDDALPDFLVSEAADIYGTPNKLYFSNGEVANVYAAKATLGGRLVGADVTATVTASPAQRGWNCGHVAGAGLFRYEIVSITRGDGTEIPLRNAWITDRTFRDGADPLMEERLFLFDAFETASPQTYTVVLSAKVHGDVVEVAEFGLESGSVEYAARNAVRVRFSKPVNPDTFTVKDIVLRRQGTAVKNLSGVSIAPIGESLAEYEISGLSGYCSSNGRYELVVQCAGIEDLSGRAGVSGKSVSWLLASEDAPYIVNAEGNPDSPVQNLDGIVAVTSIPVTEASAGNVSVILNGKDVSSQVTVTFSDESGTKCQIEGLDSLQQEDGDYTLVIDASNLVGVNGGAGVNNAYTVSWTRDTKAPVLNSIEKNEGLGGTTFIVDLSEDVDASTISLENFTLTRNNTEATPMPQASSSMLRALRAAGQDEVSLPPSAKLVPLGNGKYAVSGLDSVLLDDGVYTLTFNASGVADSAGNLSSGATSVTWSSDVTPPDGATDIVVSAKSGDVDSGFFTNSRELTISGKAGESGLAIDIFAKYAGGDEVPVASPELDDGLSFAATVTLPGDGAMSVIIRLTDPSGNSTDTMFQVFVDMISLEATVTGAPKPDSAAEGLTIVFSAEPDEATALAAPFSLTLDGTVIDISSAVAIVRTDAVTYVVSGLGEFTREYGDYVFTYDTRQVVKASSGISGRAASVLSWTNAAADTAPPFIEEILFDGKAPAEEYVETNCFDTVSVRFSEPVNISELVEQGVIGQVFSIQFLSDSGDVTNSIPAEDVSWDESTYTATWELDENGLPRGGARFVVDSPLVRDASGNALAATDGYDVISGSRAYTPGGVLQGMADSYAAPTLFDWDNDGLFDLFVGEKTADGKGKVRIYLNEGDASSPSFNDYAYLAKGGEDVEFPAQGCLGAQIAFGWNGSPVMYLATSQGEVHAWRYRSSDAETGEPLDFDLWFDHDTDSRFSGLKRTCLFAHDIDGDGEDEVVVSGQASPMFWMKRVVSGDDAMTQCTPLMDETGAALDFPPGQSHTSAVMLDASGDGVADLVTGDTDGNVWVYYGRQNGRFAATPVQMYANPDAAIKRSRLAVGDIDGDGVEDLLVGRSDGSIVVLKGEAVLAQAVNFQIVEPQYDTCSVTMTLDGTTTNLTLIVGAPYGELPEPAARTGRTFDGWYTGPNGTGVRVTAETVFDGTVTTLYAHWTANGADPGEAHAPVFTHISPDGDSVTIPIADSQIFAVSASDPDGDALSIEWYWCRAEDEAWEYCGEGAELLFTPDAIGHYWVEVCVSDGTHVILNDWDVECVLAGAEDYGVIDGSDLVWAKRGSTLTIGGYGPMPETVPDDPALHPYLAYVDEIDAIIVNDGVTGLAQNLFGLFPNLTTVSLPNTLEEIREGSFSGCGELEALYIPSAFLGAAGRLGLPATCNVINTDIYAFVKRLYSLCLGREPDMGGINDWSLQLASGANDGANVAFGFFMSQEMANRNLSNEDFVETLYNVMMGRASDAGGKADWVSALESGVTRTGVLRGFAESTEFTNICRSYGINRGGVNPAYLQPRDQNYGITKFVARCYTKALDRAYDADGLNYWCGVINSSANPKATAIYVSTTGFFDSQEFQLRRLGNGAFVDVLYETFLGRAADAGGRADWVSQLNAGADRHNVMAGFYNSAEFNNIMASYGIR